MIKNNRQSLTLVEMSFKDISINLTHLKISTIKVIKMFNMMICIVFHNKIMVNIFLQKLFNATKMIIQIV